MWNQQGIQRTARSRAYVPTLPQLIRGTTQVGLFLFHYFVQENHGQSHGISTVLTQQHLVLIAISQINRLFFSFGLPLTSALIAKERKKECWFKK